jgi:hypothetical protein
MINLNISAMIYQPIKQVFDFVCAPENDFQWQYGTLASARLSENVDDRLGTFFRSIGHLLGRRNLSTFEVTEYALNKKYGFKTLSGPLHSKTFYTFEMVDKSTRVTISTQVDEFNTLQFSERVLEKKMKKQLKENMAILKSLLEAKMTISAFETSLI